MRLAIETTKEFIHRIAQEEANSKGQPIEVYMSNGMWHSQPKGRISLPLGATEYDVFYPQEGTTPETPKTLKGPPTFARSIDPISSDLRAAIERVLETGNADIYYDSAFDQEDMESTTTKGVKAHHEALNNLRKQLK